MRTSHAHALKMNNAVAAKAATALLFGGGRFNEF
jgi:hypothetical protein